MEDVPVQLWMYDLSNGLARYLSKLLTKKEIEGIWHTSIVVYDKEVWYGRGITMTIPGTCHLGLPHQVMALGTTRIDERTFDEFLAETRRFYTAERYHLLGFNCNSFTNLCASFLTGHSIPELIQDLPVDFVSTTLGWLTNPIIQSIYRTAIQREMGGIEIPVLDEAEETGDQDRSNGGYGQMIQSAASSTGRVVTSAGSKVLRLVDLRLVDDIAHLDNILHISLARPDFPRANLEPTISTIMAPISVLPSEILRMIFLYFRYKDNKRVPWKTGAYTAKPISKELSNAMIVCRLWRTIITNTSLLWNRIICRPSSSFSQAYVDRLKIFIQRSGSTYIDVFIYANSLNATAYKQLWELLMEKAPFHRWRSLDLCCSTAQRVKMELVGEFTALESLIYSTHPSQTLPLLPLINRTARKLRQARICWNMDEKVLKEYPLMMRRLSIIACHHLYIKLPSNITKLYVITLPQIELPHILGLTISELDISIFQPSLFPRLERLEVVDRLAAARKNGVPVELLSLHHLAITSNDISALHLIRCPLLETLSLSRPFSKKNVYSSSDIGKGIYRGRYLLSPTTLVLDFQLPSNMLIQILEVSPRIETLQLQFDDQPLWLITALLQKSDSSHAGSGPDDLAWRLCPALITLQIKITQNQANIEGWRYFLLHILHGREGSLFVSTSCIWEDGQKITVGYM